MKDYLVVRREYDDNDEVINTMPEMRITDIPEGTTLKLLKDVLIQAGYSYQWGIHTMLPEEEWHPIKNSMDPEEVGDRQILLDWCREDISYDDLLDKLNDEKRVTLRLPVGLHFALSRAAGDMTLNAYCTKTLADAVGYSDLPEFEAQRRKPGRPKKVQDGE